MSVRKLELIWYDQHGRNESRIARDNEGKLYVIGDFAWNRKYRKRELIEYKIRYPK